MENDRPNVLMVSAEDDIVMFCIASGEVANQNSQSQSPPQTEERTPIISIISLLLTVIGVFIMGIPLGILAIIMAFVADYYGEKSALKWVGDILGLIGIFLALIVLGMLLSMLR
jgi:hypothetical protein